MYGPLLGVAWPLGDIVVSGGLVRHRDWGTGTAGIQEAEARDAIKHPTRHRTGPAAKNSLAQNVSGAEAENPTLALNIQIKWHCFKCA